MTQMGPPTIEEHEVATDLARRLGLPVEVVRAEHAELLRARVTAAAAPTGNPDSLPSLGDELRGVFGARLPAAGDPDAATAAYRAERVAAGVCENCDDAGFVRVGDPPELRACWACATPPSREVMLANSELPAMYQGWTFATFPPDPEKAAALERVERWTAAVAAGGTESLVLGGRNGRGKTGLAAAATNALLDARRAVRFAYLPQMLKEVKSRFGQGDEATVYFDRLINFPVLVLDDLAAAYLTPWAQEQITRLITERLMAELPTLITSDEGEDWMRANFHPRVTDRLNLFGTAIVEGESLRERTQRERWWA